MQDYGIKRELFFSQAEYDQRLAKLREGMATAGIDVLCCSSPENLYYFTGYQTFGFTGYQLLVIPASGSPFLILRFLESLLAARYGCVAEVLTWDDTDDPVALTIDALRTRKLLGARIGIEENAYFLQVVTWKKLAAGIPHLLDGSGLVEAVRATKSPQELAYMKEAARLTDLGMQAAADEIRGGANENDVAAAAFDAMTRAGAEYLARDPIVTSGDRAGIPHTSYMRRKIEPGDTVLLEFSGVFMRYYGPLMRSALVGSDAEIERLSDICVEALDAAIAAIRPGATSGEVDAAARSIIEREGLWENYRKRTGYSVGIGFHNWMEVAIATLKKDDPTPLRPGMCFHLPVALRLYGKAAIGVSETVYVTEQGCEVFGQFPRQLIRR